MTASEGRAAASAWRPLPVWAGGLIIVAAVGSVYYNSLDAPLVFDGEIIERQLRENPRAGLREIATLGQSRPLTFATFYWNYLSCGLDVRCFHVANIAIHAAAALVLFGLVRRTLQTRTLRRRWGSAAGAIALAAALLWATHPLATQCVTYVYQRYESLAALCYLATLYALVRSTTSTRGAWWLAGSVIVCGAGMAAKEVMVTAPLMALWYDRALLSASWRALFARRAGYYGALFCTWIILAALMLSHPGYQTAGIGRVTDLTPWLYLRSQSGVLLHYLQLAVWPIGLCFDHAWPPATTPSQWVPQSIAICSLLAGTLWCIVRKPPLGLLLGSFFLILAPTSSVVPIIDLAVEHRMYLPLASVCVLAAVAMYQVVAAIGVRMQFSPVRQQAIFLLTMAVAVTGLSILTVQRNRIYQSHLSLWTDVVAKAPHNSRGHYNLARQLAIRDERPAAESHYREAIRLKPTEADAHNGLGEILARNGNLAAAEEEFITALRLRPDYADAHKNLAGALLMTGRLDKAEMHAREALRLRPNYPDALLDLGTIAMSRGQTSVAEACFEQALALNPNFAEAHFNLGMVRGREGRIAEATAHFREALRVNPQFTPARDILEKLSRELPQ